MKVFTLFAFDENDISTNQQTYLFLYVWTGKKWVERRNITLTQLND